MTSIAVVIPCFNEAARLPAAEVFALTDAGCHVVLVDDGSTDGTKQRLAEIARARSTQVSTVVLGHNQGKGEAVRQGVLHALTLPVDAVGYLDADFSTSSSAFLLLTEALNDGAIDVVLGSRVALLGRDVRRSAVRHYLGRVFATAASLTLHLPVYDTQCGAKLFRRTPALARAMSTPFAARWAFDVELLARLLEDLPSTAFVEVPLSAWRDVGGSTLTAPAMWRAGMDLVTLAVSGRRRRRR